MRSAEIEGKTARALWESIEKIRADADLPHEGKPPNWATWANAALEKSNAEGIERAYVRYLGDEDFGDREWPIRVFQSEAVWSVRTGPARAVKGGGWR